MHLRVTSPPVSRFSSAITQNDGSNRMQVNREPWTCVLPGSLDFPRRGSFKVLWKGMCLLSFGSAVAFQVSWCGENVMPWCQLCFAVEQHLVLYGFVLALTSFLFKVHRIRTWSVQTLHAPGVGHIGVWSNRTFHWRCRTDVSKSVWLRDQECQFEVFDIPCIGQVLTLDVFCRFG